MQQDITDGFQILWFGAFRFVVADAIFARREEHGRRHDVGDKTGIVAGARRDIGVRNAEPLTSAFDRGDATLVKGDRRGVRDLFQGSNLILHLQWLHPSDTLRIVLHP